MRAVSQAQVAAESNEVVQEPLPGQMLTLAPAVMDWLATTAVDHPASVAIALALEEHARCNSSPTVVARLRRGVDANRVQAVFQQCQRERVAELANQPAMQPDAAVQNTPAGVSAEASVAGSAAVAGAQLVVEWRPVRYRRGEIDCTLDTSDEEEYRFALRAALTSLEKNITQLGHRQLERRVAEIAAEFPDVRDDLEEILWRSQN